MNKKRYIVTLKPPIKRDHVLVVEARNKEAAILEVQNILLERYEDLNLKEIKFFADEEIVKDVPWDFISTSSKKEVLKTWLTYFALVAIIYAIKKIFFN